MRLPILVTLLLALAAGTAGTAYGDDRPLPTAKVSVQEGGQATVIRIDGIITPELGDRFATVMDSLPAGRPLLLELNSPGGYTSAGYAMIDRLLAERGRGRRIATRVKGGESCESMCVGLFLAGQPRYASADAVFMVHAPRGLYSGTVTVKSTGRMIERLVDLGASAAWIERVKAQGGFSGSVDHRETAAQLVANGSNIVTDLTP